MTKPHKTLEMLIERANRKGTAKAGNWTVHFTRNATGRQMQLVDNTRQDREIFVETITIEHYGTQVLALEWEKFGEFLTSKCPKLVYYYGQSASDAAALNAVCAQFNLPDRFSFRPKNGGFMKIAPEPVGKFESLNFMIDHGSLDFVGYEFEGKEIFIDEQNDTQSLFRMDIDKETEEITVYAAYSEDFDIMEEVTEYFDTNKLAYDIFKWIKTHDVENQGDAFVAYCEAIDNGMDCDDAMYYAYESVRATEPLKLGNNIIVIEVND